jgi:hypothetical protein
VDRGPSRPVEHVQLAVERDEEQQGVDLANAAAEWPEPRAGEQIQQQTEEGMGGEEPPAVGKAGGADDRDHRDHDQVSGEQQVHRPKR